LANEGCKEVTLLGQTVNSYEFEHGDGRRARLSDLLMRISGIPGIERIKFVTNFPKDMTDDLLDAVHGLDKVSKYLHVPVQSGCNDVLKRMKRLYTVEFYRDMLQRCRERVPGVAVSSDFIVGFCGESEESFQKSCDLVREAKFKNSFIFKFSARPGTKADDLYADDVPEETKKRRNNDLLAIQNANSLDDHRAQIGRTARVLVEGLSKHGGKQLARVAQPVSGPRQLTGRTMTDHIVVFDANPRLIGQTVTVQVDEASPFTLYGSVETDEAMMPLATQPLAASRSLESNRRIGLPLL
jgi:tRNA-2-methylthio-N6-dimethylallyladenosine synthase